jgi:hypothetical protein
MKTFTNRLQLVSCSPGIKGKGSSELVSGTNLSLSPATTVRRKRARESGLDRWSSGHRSALSKGGAVSARTRRWRSYLAPERPRNALVVLDDYLTYGTSLGVGTALLQAAGAKRVTCLAMGISIPIRFLI